MRCGSVELGIELGLVHHVFIFSFVELEHIRWPVVPLGYRDRILLVLIAREVRQDVEGVQDGGEGFLFVLVPDGSECALECLPLG